MYYASIHLWHINPTLEMLIKSLSVENYRSITKTKSLPLGNLGILIGPNNEGKSNILQALVLTLKNLEDPETQFYLRHGERQRFLRSRLSRNKYYYKDRTERVSYIWERDFPIKLQGTNPTGCSTFSIDFSLSPREKNNFKRLLKSRLLDNLRIELSLGQEILDFKAWDTANIKKVLPQKNNELLVSFIKKHISVQYISAIRTSETSTRVVENMVASEIRVLEGTKEYKEAIEKLSRLQKPILEKLSKSLTENVSNFLPDIKKITIEQKNAERGIRMDSCDVTIDDGTNTHLELKGDGIQSLLAISLIQYATNQNSLGKSILLAIEEPESHLHPEAIHRLRKVLDEISLKNQVIITTHSPLLVSRKDVRKNILVNKSEAREAENVSEVRKLLGVQVADNLHSANLVFLVEGSSDIIILKSWLSEISQKTKTAIEDGIIVFDDLGGGTNLSYKSSQYKNLLCDVFVFLDGDETGQNSLNSAVAKGLISESEARLALIRGQKESEIEDMILPEIYKSIVFNKYNVRLEGTLFRNNKKKWSDRVRDTFENQGVGFNDKVEAELKEIVATEVEKVGLKSIKKTSKPILDAIVRYIENYIKNK